MVERLDIARNWLPRYTGMSLDRFGDYILLTNFQIYLTQFAEKFNCEVFGEGKPMPAATNKTDLLDPDRLDVLRNEAERRPDVVLVSARQGQGLAQLRAAIDAKLMAGHRQIDVDVPSGAGGLIHWIYENAQVLNRESDDDGNTTLTIRISACKANQLRRRVDTHTETLRES